MSRELPTPAMPGHTAPFRPGDVRIAYGILAHSKPENVEAALESVYDPRDLFLVNIDAKAPPDFAEAVARLARGRGNVHLLPRRRVDWGRWNTVAAELAMIRHALAAPVGWTHFQNLSGQCLAIRPRCELVGHLAGKPGVNFIGAGTLEENPDDPGWRSQLRANVTLHFRGRTKITPLRLPPPVLFRFGWKGSAWHMMTRAFCEWTMRSRLARYIALYCRPLFVPDELYFQQLVMNSPFAALREDTLHQIYWPTQKPKILTREDIEPLRASGRFFARKFDADVDREVMRAFAPTRSGRGVGKNPGVTGPAGPGGAGQAGSN